MTNIVITVVVGVLTSVILRLLSVVASVLWDVVRPHGRHEIGSHVTRYGKKARK